MIETSMSPAAVRGENELAHSPGGKNKPESQCLGHLASVIIAAGGSNPVRKKTIILTPWHPEKVGGDYGFSSHREAV